MANLVVVCDVSQHALDSLAGGVAFAVVAPASGPVAGRVGNAVRQPTAERLRAGRMTPFVVVRIEMRIGEVEDLQRSHVGGRKSDDSARFGYGRKRNFPVVVGVVGDGADVADDETADLVGGEDEPGQDVDHLFGHDVDDALAHAARFDFHADAEFGRCVDDVVRRFATVHVVL